MPSRNSPTIVSSTTTSKRKTIGLSVTPYSKPPSTITKPVDCQHKAEDGGGRDDEHWDGGRLEQNQRGAGEGR